MANQNGTLIIEALKESEEPMTLTKIANQIANRAGASLDEVRETVKETLDGGVRYGFVQKSGRKYYAAPLELAQTNEEDTEQSDGADSSHGIMEDRSGRRRRRSRSSQHKGKGARVSNRRSRSRRRRGGRQ